MRATRRRALARLLDPLLPAAQNSLRPGEACSVLGLRAWIGNPFSRRKGHKRAEPGVTSDMGLHWRQGADGSVHNPQGDVPAASRVATDGHRARLAPFGQRSGPADVQRPAQLYQSELPVLEAEPRACVLGSVIVTP